MLNTGIIPNTWAIGVIRPIYKNKGAKNDPNNYRGISLLSCFGKLFTSVLNKRVAIFLENFDILGVEQTGFRKGFSTTDNLFTIYGIIDILLFKRERLYCAFLDYEKAFDKIDRALLWQKLINDNMNSKLLDVIKNMYSIAKSCISVDGEISDFFKVDVGVRQGENLSPVLFSLFLNDMNNFIGKKMKGLDSFVTSINELNMDAVTTNVFLRLFVLLYADDTVLFAESANDLQNGLSETKKYCEIWKVKLNVNKCKVMIFSRGLVRKYPTCYIGNDKLEVVKHFQYLGLRLNYNNKMNVAQKDVYERASRAMFLLTKKCVTLHLPVDVMIDLFDKTVIPVLTYGCEIWGHECIGIIEKLQLKYYKNILRLRNSTPSAMVFGEVGRYPVLIHIKTRLLCYWYKLINNVSKPSLSSHVYHIMYNMHIMNIYTSPYLKFVKNTLIEVGMYGLWLSHDLSNISKNVFKSHIKNTLNDLYVQNWYSKLENGSIYTNYRLFKKSFSQEIYLKIMSHDCLITLARFRTTNNKLPVNALRFDGLDRNDRKCSKCNLQEVGDEFHYIFICEFYREKRKELLPRLMRKRPNTLTFYELMNSDNKKILLKLKILVDHINRTMNDLTP